jgi:hypothetical protein
VVLDYYTFIPGVDNGSLVAVFGFIISLLLIFAAARLWIAYRLYLTFDHAIWVVLSSQIIVLLGFAVVMLNLDRLGF